MAERTIDQRIEALTHSVELLASLYRDRERVFYDALKEQRNSHHLLLANVQTIGGALTLMANSLDKLVQVADRHEQRVGKLELGAQST